MARIQEPQFKKREREKGEREKRKGTHRHMHTQRHAHTPRHTHSGARTPSHAHTGRERHTHRALLAARLHREPLLPSTASRCKHRHPICVGVNWLFDVSRKVLPLERSQSPLLPRFPACALK